MSYKIPLSVPSLNGNEWEYVKECLDSNWVSSAGAYVDLFEQNIAKYTGSKFAVACMNGTAALQVSLRLAGVKPDHEVIVSTLTFIASVNAIAYNNAKPVFMDTDKYFNINVEKTIEFIKNETIYKSGFSYNKKTNKLISAIIPVHVWGNACYLDELVRLCGERNIAIVEDAAESLGTFYNEGNYKGKHTGTIGKLGCLSFNGNKIITTGGGGMILTDDESIAIKARYLTTQAKDDPVRYVHDKIGYNFRLTNIQAAIGVAQLEQLPSILKRKEEIYNFYKTSMFDIDGLSIAQVPDYSINNHWMNILQVNSDAYGENIEHLIKRLEKNNVQTRPVWKLNHEQMPYNKCHSFKIDNAKNIVKNSLCLPSSSNLTNKNIKTVIAQLNA